MKYNVRLGDKVKDKISGFEGIVMGIHHWRDGTVDVNIYPEGLQNGEPIKPQVVEMAQVEITAQQALPAPEMPKPRFDLGATVRHNRLGFEGYISAWSFYYHGCHRYQIQRPLNKDGKIPEGIGCIEQDLDLVEVPGAKAVKEPVATGKGGPQNHATRNL